ncbi:MAG: carboxypeptidase-like regulatory domain-containing protein [Bacteroidetes bacterium]|nr:MAG: carboxypeptidase-like regulatory domain-containing protein [Bacteroidota bacterium]
MDCLKSRIIFLALLVLFSQGGKAATVSGKVTDENKEALPFAGVYLRGTTQGVTTNKEGNYSIELPVGEHDLVFQFIGYKTHTEKVKVEGADEKIILHVKMEPQPYEIGTVTINASGEDPACEVMRKAIRMRKYYLNQIESYSCDVYIKGLQRMKSYPKKFMGFDVNAEGDIDPKTGIFYLSESVSKFYFKQPDKVYEKMISSKVSGNSKAFSFNRTTDLLLNFYQNVVNVQVIAKRGFVSPIAEGAMFYYKYHLIGSFFENGKLVNKVEVIPKRTHDPVFRGTIYICETTWRIHSTDLYLVKDAGIEVVDTLRINQVHLPVISSTAPSRLTPNPSPSGEGETAFSEVWMLFSNKLTFSFSIFAFKGNGWYLSIHSKYNMKPDLSVKNPIPFAPVEQATTATLLPKELKQKKKEEKKINKGFSSGEMMKVEEDANKKDSLYWVEARPVPLTQEEFVDYKKKDSAQVIHESKPFLDSVDKKTNRFEPMDFLFGYEQVNRYKKRNISFSPLIQSVQFNTVQGLVLGSELEIQRKYERKKRFYKTMAVSYGFSGKRINASAKFLYEFNPKKFSHTAVEGGRQTIQFSERKPISPLVNTLYTLLDESNYMKLYQKDLLKLSYNSELVNGIYLKSFLEYSDRSPLMNTSDFVLFPVAENHKVYSSNDPLSPIQDSATSFTRNQAIELRINLRLRYKQKYIARPDEKWVYGSAYPTLHLEYRKGINSLLSSDVNYDLVKVGITDRMNFKLLGKATYLVSAGKFLNSGKMELMDHYHFSGNKTIFSNFDFSDFQMLDYYTYSTRDKFIEAHYEHDFSGFILNKLPLLRKLKVNELAGVHYLCTEKIQNYTEVFFGMEKLNLARIDFVMAFSENQKVTIGVKLGLKIDR